MIEKTYDFLRFDVLMDTLQKWRNADHADSIVLCRSDVVVLIEGVKAMSKERE